MAFLNDQFENFVCAQTETFVGQPCKHTFRLFSCMLLYIWRDCIAGLWYVHSFFKKKISVRVRLALIRISFYC
jgi:hypothetical protein